jgi:hypothetical protein
VSVAVRARRQRRSTQALVVLVRRRLEPRHLAAGGYLPTEVIVAEIQRHHLGLPQRHRHPAVEPVVAQVQEQQALGHLHPRQVEPELVPGQVEGPAQRLVPPEQERRVAGETVVGHPELHHVSLERVCQRDRPGQPVAVQTQGGRAVGHASHRPRRDGPDEVVVGRVEAGQVRQLLQRPGDRAGEPVPGEADGGEVDAGILPETPVTMMLKIERCGRLPKESGIGPCRPGMFMMLSVSSMSSSPMAGGSVELIGRFPRKKSLVTRPCSLHAAGHHETQVVPGRHPTNRAGLPNCSRILISAGRSRSDS